MYANIHVYVYINNIHKHTPAARFGVAGSVFREAGIWPYSDSGHDLILAHTLESFAAAVERQACYVAACQRQQWLWIESTLLYSTLRWYYGTDFAR